MNGLRESAVVCAVVRIVDSQPASEAAHDAIVALGFEGTVLKRRRSTSRAGRQSTWLKCKARRVAQGHILALREDRKARRWAVCEVEGRKVIADARGVTQDAVGQPVRNVFSRRDADGGLREARVDIGRAAPRALSTRCQRR